MTADPDWADIATRAARVRKDALAAFGEASFSDIADALFDLAGEEIDAVAREELLVARLPPSCPISLGLAQHTRRAQLIVRAHELFRALAPHEAAILAIAADAVKAAVSNR